MKHVENTLQHIPLKDQAADTNEGCIRLQLSNAHNQMDELEEGIKELVRRIDSMLISEDAVVSDAPALPVPLTEMETILNELIQRERTLTWMVASAIDRLRL